MAAFLVVTLQVWDTTAFGAYRDAIAGLEAEYGGRYLVRAPVLERLEGDSPGLDASAEHVVVMAFPDAQSIRNFIGSNAYQAAKRLRAGAATLNMRLVTEDL